MFAAIGLVVVLGAILGGYLLEKGNLLVLLQPAELLIIGGSALGTLLIANPTHVILAMAKQVPAVFKGSRYSRVFYLETLRMVTEFFGQARRNGFASVEAHIEDPGKSAILNKYKGFMGDHHAVKFFCDSLRSASSGGVSHTDLDLVMELDIEVHHRTSQKPISALSTMADSLPGLGIVAAVLGIVITMGALGGPPEEIGHKVAAALVGTFLGILLCYGFVGPIAGNLKKLSDEESEYYHCLRIAIVSFMKGAAPILAAEFARRAIPTHARPTFQEMEAACKAKPA